VLILKPRGGRKGGGIGKRGLQEGRRNDPNMVVCLGRGGRGQGNPSLHQTRRGWVRELAGVRKNVNVPFGKREKRGRQKENEHPPGVPARET